MPKLLSAQPGTAALHNKKLREVYKEASLFLMMLLIYKNCSPAFSIFLKKGHKCSPLDKWAWKGLNKSFSPFSHLSGGKFKLERKKR